MSNGDYILVLLSFSFNEKFKTILQIENLPEYIQDFFTKKFQQAPLNGVLKLQTIYRPTNGCLYHSI